MFRFDQLIRHTTVVRDVKQQYPQTVEIFESLGIRPSCDDCDIETVARKSGLNSVDLVDRLNRAAFGNQPES